MRYMILVLLLAGCATATEIKTGDTQQSYIIGCHGMALSMASCFEKANEVCPYGYTPLGNAGESYPLTVAQGTAQGAVTPNSGAFLSQQTYTQGAVIYRYLTVQCKPNTYWNRQ